MARIGPTAVLIKEVVAPGAADGTPLGPQLDAAIDLHGQSRHAECQAAIEELFSSPLARDPSSTPALALAHVLAGDVYESLRQDKAAFAEYVAARQLVDVMDDFDAGDLSPLTYGRIGGAYLHMGDFEKALAYFDKARTIRQRARDTRLPGGLTR
eukprot:m51a1_g32 hypothetical protein (155) ;mRNA; r:128509-128973